MQQIEADISYNVTNKELRTIEFKGLKLNPKDLLRFKSEIEDLCQRFLGRYEA